MIRGDHRRVLLVDTSPYSSFGGSKRVLCNLALRLGDRGWQPHVVFHAEGSFADLLREAGIPVRVVHESAGRRGQEEPPVASRREQPAAAADGPPRSTAARSGRLGEIRRTLGVQGDPAHGTRRAGWRRRLRDLRSLLHLAVRDPRRGVACGAYFSPAPDIVHLNAPAHDDYAWTVAARLHGIPYCTHEHGIWAGPPAAFRRVARQAAAVFCLTAERQEQVRAFCHGDVRTVFLPNGLDPEAFRPRRPRNEVRASIGVPPEHLLFLTPGHLHPWKGQAQIPGTARALAAAGLPFVWAICGSTLDPDFAADLQREIEDLQPAGVVRLLGPRDDMPDLYGAADLTVHTTMRPEPFGMVLLESMAAGTPVVASAEGAVPEIIRDGVEGRLYRPRDREDLARAILQLAASPQDRRRMGDAGRERVNREYHIDRQVELLVGAYVDTLRRQCSR